MGRALFERFLSGAPAGTGVRWGAHRVGWDELAARGRELAELVRPQQAYVVDPAAGPDALAALLAVGSVPDTLLLWADPAALALGGTPAAPGLTRVDNPLGTLKRPMWGVCTSGSSGTPKVALGFADQLELVALHYDAAFHGPLSAGGGGAEPPVLATCLPLKFSAAFFMSVLPALFLRRELLVFPQDDWSPVVETARDRDVAVLGVPALAAAACLGTPRPVDMRRVSLTLGGGHLAAERVRLIRERFAGVRLANLYGTAETGALTLDPDPGHNRHVGRPVPGKAVWIADPDERGAGAVAAAGPDCCHAVWQPGGDPVPTGGVVASTDYGHFDAEGNLCLDGRVDGGEKLAGVLVYPREIERHLLALPGVVDARVLVRRTAAGLEQLAARVVGRVDEAAVRAHCAQLAESARPTRVECVPEDAALAAYSAHGKL